MPPPGVEDFNYNHGVLNRSTFVIGVLVATCGCGVVPRVNYRVPGVAASPFGARVVDASASFARTFCQTLSHLDPAHTAWGSCTQYLEAATAQEPPAADAIPTELGVLVVGGIFSHCFESKGVKVFEQALLHLERDHHIKVATIPVSGVATPEANASVINKYLTENPGNYIAVGHSKGAVDLMTAIHLYPSAQTQIKALASVAGAVAGSRLADLGVPATIAGFQLAARQSGLGRCSITNEGGVESLRREVRYKFLTQWNPPAGLRRLSLVGVVPEEKTSRPLRTGWRRLENYSLDQDSQVIAEESIMPGAEFLGVAKGDHWALALPLSEHPDPKIRTAVTENRFPRIALLEAIVRQVHGIH